nr:hypothetical protein [Tanacetum cinerariifolium]
MGRDTVQLETAVNTISQEYHLEFTSEYGIPEMLHPELPGPEDRIVDFPEGKKSPATPHEVPLSTLTAHRVIEMDDPAAATNSSGVPSTIERSPLDFAHEAEASDQGTAAPEMPPFEDVPATVAPGAGQAEEVAAADPPAAAESRKRGRNGIDVNTPPKVFPSLLDTPEACQDLVDHVAPLGYFSELRHLHNDEFLRRYNVNLARQVARRDKRIQARELEIKNLEALLEAETNTRKPRKTRVATLQQQVSGEEKLKAAFEEFKRQQDDRVEQRCAEMDARLDALSIDFDEELYPHMLTAIAGRQWVIGHGLRLAVMKCGESLELRQAFADVVSTGIAKGLSDGLRHGLEHGQARLSLESIEAYDPEGEAKFVTALQALKDLKYPLVDQLKGLNDASMDVIMAALYLGSDTGDDALQDIRDLRPSSSQLTIPVYLEVRDLRNPWACKEEMVLADAIAANISRAEKKKCRIVYRTHGVGSAHHARSDGVPVSAPTVVPQGLALLLADAATQTKLENDT